MEWQRKLITDLANSHGWDEIDYQDNIKMLSFSKLSMRINVYLTKMTVATCLDHPKHGKTQMFRRNVDIDLLTKLFKNPRHHSGKGYRKKK